MALAEELGLEADRVARRIHFLEQRAEAHLSREESRPDFEIACAAALWRDAAALALLLDDPVRARQFLMRAGSSFAQLGLFAGYALMSLAAPDTWASERRAELSDVLSLLREEVVPKQVDRRVDFEQSLRSLQERAARPFLNASLSSKRQLTHLYQAFSAQRGDDDLSVNFIALLRPRLLEAPASPIGPTGVPLQTYLKVMEAGRHGDFSASARETLSAIASLRAEQLRAAQADSYHWRRALAPADLIDFDLVALAAVTWDARQTLEGIEEPFRRWESGVDAPLRAAADLRMSASRRPRF